MLGQFVLFAFQVVFCFYGILACRKYLGYDNPDTETPEETKPEEG